MTDTLFDVIRELGRLVGGSRTGLATGGTTTTIIDTRRGEADTIFDEGTALILTDAAGAGAAPEDQWSVISGWVNATTTATVYDAFTVAPAVGDRYMFIPPKYPLDWMIDKVNQVLQRERLSAIDSTSLDVVADQLEYELPAGITRDNLRQVWIETEDDDDNKKWMMCQGIRVEPGITSAVHTLLFRYDVDALHADSDIKLIYTPYHPAAYLPTAEINEAVHIDRIIWPALEAILLDELARNTGDKHISQRLNWTREKVTEVKEQHPIMLPPWHDRGSGW